LLFGICTAGIKKPLIQKIRPVAGGAAAVVQTIAPRTPAPSKDIRNNNKKNQGVTRLKANPKRASLIKRGFDQIKEKRFSLEAFLGMSILVATGAGEALGHP